MVDYSAKISGDLPLVDALAIWHRWAVTKYAPRSVQVFLWHLNKFVGLHKDKTLRDITPVTISEYCLLLQRSRYSTASVAHTMITVRQFFRFFFLQRAVDWDWQLIGVPRYVNRSWTPVKAEEASEMVKEAEEGNGLDLTFRQLRNKLIVMFLYASGVRVSELCAICIGDMHAKERYATIITRKNYKKRLVFWDEQTDRLLAEYLPLRDLVAKSDYLFISLDKKNFGRRLTTRSIQRIIAELRGPKRHVKCHSFRHSLGKRAAEAELHPRFIQLILGHKNIQSSQIYMDVDDKSISRAYRRIARTAPLVDVERVVDRVIAEA